MNMDERLDEAQSNIVRQYLDTGLAAAPPGGGDSKTTEPVTFRASEQMLAMLQKIQEMLNPRYKGRSAVLRALVWHAMNGFLETYEQGELGKLIYSINEEREQNMLVIAEEAKQALSGRVRRVSEIVSEYRNNGELDEAVPFLRAIVERIEGEPSAVRKNRQRQSLSRQQNVYDAMQQAAREEIPGALMVLEYIDQYKGTTY